MYMLPHRQSCVHTLAIGTQIISVHLLVSLHHASRNLPMLHAPPCVPVQGVWCPTWQGRATGLLLIAQWSRPSPGLASQLSSWTPLQSLWGLGSASASGWVGGFPGKLGVSQGTQRVSNSCSCGSGHLLSGYICGSQCGAGTQPMPQGGWLKAGQGALAQDGPEELSLGLRVGA